MGLQSCEKLKLVTLHCAISSQNNAPTPATQGEPPNILCNQLMPQAIQGKPLKTAADLMRMYPERFDRIGCSPGKAKLVVDEKIEPHIDAPRKTPIALKDQIMDALNSMQDDAIIRKVTEPTDWVSSLAYSKKRDGSLRICLDPRYLNTALKRPHHRIPTLEELTHQFRGAKIFSKLDAKSGYWSVQLDNDSQLLTTFQSPFGRFCFQRLPFGLNVSQDIFQLRMDQILDQVDGAIGIGDDVAVYGRTEEEHDHNLYKLMDVAEKNGLVFNSTKCEIKQSSISFFGMTNTDQGVRPDRAKIEDLQSMPHPTNKKELKEFLGFVNYLSPFIDNLAHQSATLRDLLKKEVPFMWEAHQQKCFEQLKNAVTDQTTLQYFDTGITPVIQTDASLRGIGSVLMQDEKPIAFASKTLSDVERRYACIERELLAVVFSVQRFHTYVYGRHFKVLTDHKPLVMIVQKPLTSAPPRLQRMLLQLHGYDFSLHHISGKDMTVVDTLSRLPTSESRTIDLDIRVDHVQFSNDRIINIREETQKDSILSALKEIVVTGWPTTIKDVPTSPREYFPMRDELAVENGIILKGCRIVVPKVTQQNILAQLHYSHSGIEKTKLRAKDAIYWIGINKDIENLVKSCPICQTHQPMQCKETLQQHEIPTKPWDIVGTDLFQFDKSEYLIVSDYYSKFVIVRTLPTHYTSQIVIAALKQIFGEHGIPSRVISDNGPQYSSASFREFANEWCFDHVTSSPRYPKSNGFIERQIRTTKSVLLKSKDAGTDAELALLSVRTTPISQNLPSPAELLTGRKYRSDILTKISTARNSDEVKEELAVRQSNQKTYHDKNSHDLPPLIPGQPVMVRLTPDSHTWSPALVKSRCKGPRSYIIITVET